ncbi:uncharacterized protein VTP21DRAFT_1239 [Calcarisporiella thermophila]|uniref:uncharacterized protein n=1 Tax=Calcarisporiella thermophila TaxID=911321 RepID=UPI003742060B
MAPNWPGRALCIVGFMLLMHSAYSTFEHLAYMKAVDKQESVLPIDIMAECLLSVLIYIAGITLVTGPFKEIKMETEMAKQTLAKVNACPSFITFNHRGRLN